MSSQIKRTDFYEDKILAPMREEFELTTAAALEFNAQLVVVAKNQALIGKNAKNNAKGYQQLAEAEKKSVAALNEKQKMDKRIITLQQQATKVTKAQRDAQAALSVEVQRRNKIAKQEAQLTNQNLGAYERLQVKIKKLSDEYRNLVAAEGRETAQARVLKKEILELNAIRDKSNEALGMHQHKVGQYERALGGLTRTLTSLGLSFGVFSLLRNSFGIISEYEKATASLSAITGMVGDDLKELKGTVLDTAQEMKTSVTATTKLFEIVGSQMPQLLTDAEGLRKVSESAIILSKASGDTIEGSTLAMASAMNQFSLEADQANRVMNVLAAGSLVGSAGITDVSESLKNVGSVASGSNISLEQTVALIEVLGKFGVTGAEAGTKLRGSILKLQQAGIGYASGQFQINDALEEAAIKMANLRTEKEKDAFLQKTFGAENIATGRILLANIELFEEYTKGVTGTNVATQQAAINSDTMNVVLDELKNSWENLIVKWSESTTLLGGMKTIIRFVSNNLETIVKIVFGAVRAWAAYTIQQKLWRYEMDKNNKLIRMGLIPNLIESTKGIFAAANAFRVGTISAKAFGDTLKRIPFLAILSAVGTLVSLFWDTSEAVDATADGMGDLEEETLGLANVNKKLTAEMAKEEAQLTAVFDALAATKHGTDERKKGLQELGKVHGIYLKDIKNEIEFNRQLSEAYAVVVKNMEAKIRMRLVEEEITALLEKRILLENKLEPINEQRRLKNLEDQKRIQQEINDLKAQEIFIPQYDASGNLVTKEQQLADLNAQLIALKRNEGAVGDVSLIIGEEGLESIDYINYQIEQLKNSVGEIQPFSFVERQYSSDTGTGAKQKTQLELDQEYFKRYQDNNANNLKIIENNAIKSGKTQEEIAKIMAAARLEILKMENEKALELFGQYSTEYTDANLALNKALAEQQDVKFKTQLEKDRAYFEELKKANEEGLSNYENTLLKEGKSREEIEEALQKQRIENLKYENEEALRLFGEYSEEYMAANLALNRALLTEEEELRKKQEELRKEAMKALEEGVKDLANFITEAIQRTMSLLDRQISKQEEIYGDAKDREAELSKIAEERGLNATESIEAERDAQKKAMQEIEKLEAKKRELELRIAAMRLLADGHSVADIKQNLTDIVGFVKSLPTFFEGTPYTLADSLGATGTRDGHIIRADDGEAIFTGKQARALNIRPGGNSTQDIVDMITKGSILNDSLRMSLPNGLHMLPVVSAAGSGNNALLAKQLDQVIKNTDPLNQPTDKTAFDAFTGYLTWEHKDRLRRTKEQFVVRRKK